MANALEAAILLKLLPTLTRIRYAELASTVIILYDHVLTLDQEIRLIWRAQWSLGKFLFLINRYYALCIVIYNNYVLFNTDTLTESFCIHWFRWQGATGVLTFIIAELILQLRLYALYFRDKRVLACITFVSLGAAASSAYVMGHALTLIISYAIKLPNNGSTVCVPFGLPDNFYAFWIPMLVSESVLCGFALFRGFRSYRPAENVLQSGRRIVEVLVRDSVSYFVIIFATYLTNAIIFLTRPDAEVEIPIGFAVALSCVMSSRLCLNVRGYIRDDDPGPSSMVHSGAGARYTYPRSAYASVSFGGGADAGGSDTSQSFGALELHHQLHSQSHSQIQSQLSHSQSQRSHYEHELDRERERDQDVESHYHSYESGGGTVSLKVVHAGAGGAPLGALEMRELRTMRAESPGGARHQLRMFSLARSKSAGSGHSVVHIQ